MTADSVVEPTEERYEAWIAATIATASPMTPERARRLAALLLDDDSTGS
jgi:hypothetical protein